MDYKKDIAKSVSQFFCQTTVCIRLHRARRARSIFCIGDGDTDTLELQGTQLFQEERQASNSASDPRSKGRHQYEKKTFQFGHCPNYPTPPAPPPIWATLPTFSGRKKTTFCAYGGKNIDDDNNCCHANFDPNFGNFDDNDDKTY